MSAYSTHAGDNDVVFYATENEMEVGWFGMTDAVLHWYKPRNDTSGAVTFTLVMDYVQTNSWSQVSINKGPGTAGLTLDYLNGLVVADEFVAAIWKGWFGEFAIDTKIHC
jgi:hypothetical protein